MALASLQHILFSVLFLVLHPGSLSFAPKASSETLNTNRFVPIMASCMDMEGHPSTLPGDPSLNLVTNIDLGDKKLDFMKACSKAICEATGKPEAYVAVTVKDNADLLFGGTDDPTAMGCLYSIGAISMESNSALQNSVTDLLEPYGVAANRIYINFFDMPRANVGWNRKTFAG